MVSVLRGEFGRRLRDRLLWACLASSFGFANAQECVPADLHVLVRDAQAQPIADAVVTISTAGNQALTGSTQLTGIAAFGKVPCGTWTIRAAAPGFEGGVAKAAMGGQPAVEITIALNPQIKRETLDVIDSVAQSEQNSTQSNQVRREEIKPLPARPASVTDVLPLLPGIVRTPQGELKLDGSGEQRSALIVNQSNVTDPATGSFGQSLPVDAIENVTVLSTPLLAQYGRFTQRVVVVKTRRGGDKWHGDVNDLLPGFRVRSYHIRGLRHERARTSFGGPLIRDRLFVSAAGQYLLEKIPNRTLPFPFNESKQERINSFAQIDFIASGRNVVNAALHFSPEHADFVNPDYFRPQPATPSYAQRSYFATVADHLALGGATLDSSVSWQRYRTAIGAQGEADLLLTPGGNRGNYFARIRRDAERQEWLESLVPCSASTGGLTPDAVRHVSHEVR